jgi:hypothetical protein
MYFLEMRYNGFRNQLITLIFRYAICHQLIPRNFRKKYFNNEIYILIRFNHIMVVCSIHRHSYNDFGSQLQWMQYRVCNNFNVSNQYQKFDSSRNYN